MIIKGITLIAVKDLPTDIIIGHLTLKENDIYVHLSRYFRKEGWTNAGHDTAVRKSCRSTEPACQKYQGGPIASLSTKMAMGQGKAHTIVHISELLPREDAQDPTEGLMPSDIVPGIEPVQTNESEIEFKVRGNETESAKLRQFLNSNRTLFSSLRSLSQRDPA